MMCCVTSRSWPPNRKRSCGICIGCHLTCLVVTSIAFADDEQQPNENNLLSTNIVNKTSIEVGCSRGAHQIRSTPEHEQQQQGSNRTTRQRLQGKEHTINNIRSVSARNKNTDERSQEMAVGSSFYILFSMIHGTSSSLSYCIKAAKQLVQTHGGLKAAIVTQTITSMETLVSVDGETTLHVRCYPFSFFRIHMLRQSCCTSALYSKPSP